MPLQRRSRTAAADRARAHGPFAAVVRARRQELRLRQEDLADLAGVSRTVILSLEAGRSTSLEGLLAVLEVLGLHLELTRGADSSGIAVSNDLAEQFALTGDAAATADRPEARADE